MHLMVPGRPACAMRASVVGDRRLSDCGASAVQAGDAASGAVLASDAFFPFSWGDSVELACQAGVAAIVHPGGSMRDQDAVDVCNKYGVVLLTTGHRHFKH